MRLHNSRDETLLRFHSNGDLNNQFLSEEVELMCCGVLKAAGGLGAIVALILVVVALLKQVVLLLGFLLAALKIAIIVLFVAVLVMNVLAILRDRSRRRRETEI